MFNLSEIMQAAHRYAKAFAGRDWTYKQLVKWGLQKAWELARDVRTAAQRRAEEVKAEIAALSYKSARIDTTATRRVLEAELLALAA